jgi:ketosteroid isomerase-like protein
MLSTNVTSLQQVYDDHWSRGDWSPRFELYADDFEWGWSEEFPDIAGVWRDYRTPNPRLQLWLSSWELWRCEAEEYIENGDVVLVLARYLGRGKGSGAEIEAHGAHVWELRDGKAVRLEVFADRERAYAQAGLR